MLCFIGELTLEKSSHLIFSCKLCFIQKQIGNQPRRQTRLHKRVTYIQYTTWRNTITQNEQHWSNENICGLRLSRAALILWTSMWTEIIQSSTDPMKIYVDWNYPERYKQFLSKCGIRRVILRIIIKCRNRDKKNGKRLRSINSWWRPCKYPCADFDLTVHVMNMCN